jgi:hypothetical protein
LNKSFYNFTNKSNYFYEIKFMYLFKDDKNLIKLLKKLYKIELRSLVGSIFSSFLFLFDFGVNLSFFAFIIG